MMFEGKALSVGRSGNRTWAANFSGLRQVKLHFRGTLEG